MTRSRTHHVRTDTVMIKLNKKLQTQDTKIKNKYTVLINFKIDFPGNIVSEELCYLTGYYFALQQRPPGVCREPKSIASVQALFLENTQIRKHTIHASSSCPCFSACPFLSDKALRSVNRGYPARNSPEVKRGLFAGVEEVAGRFHLAVEKVAGGLLQVR